MKTPPLPSLRITHFLCIALLFILPASAFAFAVQTADDVLDVTAAVSDAVPRITLSWTTTASETANLKPLLADNTFTVAVPGPYPAWLGVATSGSSFVAVGQNGLVFTSDSNATTWTSQNSSVSTTLQKVIWTGSQYVASGSNGVLLTSPDGVAWVSQNTGSTQWLDGLAANGSTLVAVGAGGTILTSTNGGVSWTAQSVGYVTLNDVIWTGSQFVAVGTNASIFTSTDGATWTARSVTNGYAWTFNCAVWDGTKISIFGPFDSTLGNIEYQSANGGATWTFVSNTANNLGTVVWTGSSYFGPSLNSTNGYISASGTTWTSQSFIRGQIMRAGAWNGKKLVGVGDQSTVWVSTAISPTSVTWSNPHGFLAGTFTAGAWNGSRAVVVDSLGNVYNSDDLGATWTNPAVLGTTNLTCATWSGSTSNLFIAGGSLGELYTSPDGATWTARASGVTMALRHIAASGTTMIAVGDSGAVVKTADGATWQKVTSAAVGANNLSGVAWGSGKFVAVGYTGITTSGTSFTSPDGATWTAAAISGTSPNCVEWLGTQFVAGCNLGMYYSPDGVTWSAGTIPVTSGSFTPGNYTGVASSGTTILAVAASNRNALHGSDGRTWTSTFSQSPSGNVISVGNGFLIPQASSIKFSSWGIAGQIVRRRVKGDNKWGANIYVSGSTYANSTAQAGVIYEYEVIRTYTPWVSLGITHTGASGFIHAGSKVPLVENRGSLSLFCDNTTAPALATELAQLQQDLVGDGWTVLRHDVPRMQISGSDTNPANYVARRAEIDAIRNQVRADRAANPNLKQVYLFGHVAIPYVGQSNNDGHTNHYGAFPLDTYYGELDTVWSDSAVDTVKSNYTVGVTLLDTRGINVPGDGKLDPRPNGGTYQATMPAPLTVAVGRVDMSNLTVFPSPDESETDLLRRYLRREHNYRFHSGIYANLLNKALYNDAWTFSDTGRDIVRNTSGIFGRNAIDTGTLLSLPATSTYTFGEFGGAGSETGMAWVGDSVGFGQQRSGAVFTYSFGSYFFDWDYKDNILRGVLAATEDSAGLTSTWFYSCGNYYYGMSMGETIGWNWLQPYRYNTAAGTSLYEFWLKDSIDGFSGTGGTSGNLHGDPALRTFMFEPPTNLQGQPTAAGVALTWTPSTAAGVLGYHIYRSGTSSGPFTRISGGGQPISSTNPVDVLVTGTIFTDPTAITGQTYTYMVRAVRLEQTGGGSFYNQSVGVFTTQTAATGTGLVNPTNLTITPVTSTQINLSWTAVAGATGYVIQRQSEGGAWTTIQTVASGSNSYVDSGPLTVGAVLAYRISATGSSGVASSWSDSVIGSAIKAEVTLANDTLAANLPAISTGITVQRVGSPIGTASVTYNTQDSGAFAGIDYVATSGTLTWADGDNNSKTVNVPLLSRVYFAPRAFDFFISTTGSSNLVSGAFPYARILINDTSKAPTWLDDCVPNGVLLEGASAVDGPQIGSSLCSIAANDSSGDLHRFLYHPMLGNGSLVVRVTEQSPDMKVSNWATSGYAGISVTDSIAVAPRRYSLFLRSSSAVSGAGRAVEAELRSVSKGAVAVTTQSGTTPVPYWLRITRSGTGDIFVGESSPDGLVWKTVSTGTCSGMPPVLYWGIAHASNTEWGNIPGATKYYGSFSTATFDNFTLKNADSPSGMTATPVSSSQINLAWTGTSSPISGYRVETSGNGTDSWRTLAVTGSTTTTYSHTGLSPGQRAYYRVSPVYMTPMVSGTDYLPSYYPATGRVLFRETFYDPWAVNCGWYIYLTGTATNNTANLGLSTVNGESVWGINNGTMPLTTVGALFSISQAGMGVNSKRFLCFTDKYAIPATTAALNTLIISMQALSTHTTPSLWRFAVRVGTQWYVTQQQYAAPGTSLWVNYSVDLSTNPAWFPVAFVPGSTLSIGTSTVSLPAGDLTAYGFYGDDGFSASFGLGWDNYTICTPDPKVSMATANATTATYFQLWAQSHGLPIDGTGNGAVNATPANDGIQNLLKAALGIDPNVNGYQGNFATGKMQVAGKTYLNMTYTIPEPTPAGITYIPQAGSTLSDWTDADVVQVSSTVNGNQRTIVVRDVQAIENNPKRFLQLSVAGY